MAIESAKFIGDMNTSIPTPRDSMSEGAAQIAAVKRAVVGSFPNVKGKVTVSQDDLNNLVSGKPLFARGMIMPFWGNTLPRFWVWCDGRNGTPNLNTSDVTYLCGSSKARGTKLGSNTETNIARYLKSDGHALTDLQMPKHSHNTLWHTQLSHTWEGGNSSNYGIDRNGWYSKVTDNTGGGKEHSHPMSTNRAYVFDKRPKTITVKYIMYVGEEVVV